MDPVAEPGTFVLETAVALTLAHLLADFVLQTDRMVAGKRRLPVLLLHGIVVAVTSWIALGASLAAWPIALVAVSHVAIDAVKLRTGGPGFRPFALDQAAHLTVIVLVAALFPDTWSLGIFAHPDIARTTDIPSAMLVAAGVVATVIAGGHAVGALMTGIALPPDPADNPSLPQGGRLIGRLERLMIFILVLAGEIVGIGFLIAAKSILRFGELQAGERRLVAEYVIIGTLASFAWALGVSLAVKELLTALAGGS